MNKQKGFTIIELIVVIAIIAVLAAIVLVNVTQYINKGKDAAVKGNMSTILTNAAIWIDTPANSGVYTGFSANALYSGPAAAITSASAAPAYVGTTSAFCVTALLKDATTYCVDSTGFKGTLVSGKCTGSTYTCN